jgi:hypothetical protein
MMVTALFHARPAMATPPDKFTSTTIAKGQFAEFQAFNQFIPPVNGGDIWLSRQKTKGLSDGYVLNNVWALGGSTGWHTHLGHTLVIVTAGALKAIKGTIPPARGPCTQRGCRLLRVVTTCTSSETKALSRHKASPSGSFRQVSRVG